MTSESIEITLSGDTVTLEKDVVNTIEVTAGTAELEAVESNTVSVVATNAATVEVYDPSIGFTYGSNPNNPFNDEECTVELLNLHGVAGLTWVQLAWIEDAPSAFSHTEVWRSTTVNLFSAAQLIGTTQDTTYTDNVDPDTEYHYWVRPVAYSGKVGQFTGPFGIEANSNKRNFAHAIQDYIDIDRLTLPIITRIEELIAASVGSEAALRDGAITKEVDYFNTEMGGWLQQLETVRLGYETETKRVEGLITEEKNVRAYGDEVLVERADLLSAEIVEEGRVRTAAIKEEERARVLANSAMAERVRLAEVAITTEESERKAAILAEESARIGANDVTLGKVESLRGELNDEVGNRAASITEERNARIAQNEIVVEKVDLLDGSISTKFSEVEGLISAEESLRLTEDGVLLGQINTLRGDFTQEGLDVRGLIEEEARIRAQKDGVLVEDFDKLSGRFDGFSASVDGVNDRIATAEGQIVEANRIRAEETGALAQSINTLNATWDGTTVDDDGNPIYPVGSLEAMLESVRITSVNDTKTDLKDYTDYIDTLSGNTDGSLAKQLQAAREAAVGDLSTYTAYIDTLTAVDDEGNPTDTSLHQMLLDAAAAGKADAITALADYLTYLDGLQATNEDGTDAVGSLKAQLQAARKGAVTDLAAYTGYIDTLKATKDDGTAEEGSLAAQLQSTRESAVSDLAAYTGYIDTLTATKDDGTPEAGSLDALLTATREAAVSDVSSTVQYVDSLQATKDDGTPEEGSLAALLESTREAAVSDVSSTVQYVDTLKATNEDGTPADGSLSALLQSTREAAVGDLSSTVTAVNTLTADVDTAGSVANYLSITETSVKGYADGVASEAETAASNYADSAVSSFKTDVFDVKVKAMDVARRQGSNLLDTTVWKEQEINGTVSGNNGINWSLNGRVDENYFIPDTGPSGQQEVLWMAMAQDGNASGGWNTSNIPIDHTRAYRSIVWIKKQTSTDGTTYLGCHGGSTANLDGSNNTNPYFWNGDLPQLNKWYMLVGIIHGSGYTGSSSGIAGLYDPVTGEKVWSFTEFKNRVGATVQNQRAYLYYTAVVGTIQYFARPRFEAIDGTEPSIYELMSTAERHAHLTETRSVVDGLSAEYSVKTDVNGHIAGFGLYNEGATSDFIVNASKFQVVHPDADSGAAFTVENGKTVIDGANIKSGVVGEFIKSAGFDGDLETTGGDTRGTTGWYIGSDGNAIFHNAYVRGTIDATSGSFSGDITGASGTFQGDLSGSTITGSKIYGTEIDGGFIRGAVIVSGTQLRNTDAGGDFFTYYDLQEYTSTKSFVKYYQGGKSNADVRYRLWTDNFMAYAYNALPNGAAYPNRYMNETVEFEFPETTINLYGRSSNEMRYTLQLQRADTGEALATLADLRTATSAWQNNSGIEVYHTGTISSYDSNGNYTSSGYTKIRGTYSYTHSGEAMNYPLRWYVEIRTWRGIYGNGSGTVTINTTNESPVV